MLNLDALTATQARNLGEISREFEPQFLTMLDKVCASNGGSRAWWLSSLASRDPNRSLFFERCCKLLLVKKTLAEGEKKITTHDGTMAKVIRKLIRAQSVSSEVKCTRKLVEVIKDRARPWVTLLLHVRLLLQRCLARKAPKEIKEKVI